MPLRGLLLRLRLEPLSLTRASRVLTSLGPVKPSIAGATNTSSAGCGPIPPMKPASGTVEQQKLQFELEDIELQLRQNRICRQLSDLQ